jgi:biopolymer transport protein ExbB
LRDYKFIITKRNYLKLLKLKKWQTLKKKALQTVVEWFQGLLLAACSVGVIIWKFIMGNPENFEGGNIETGTPLNFRSSISRWCSCTSIIRNVVNGTCFSIERFFVLAAGKLT